MDNPLNHRDTLDYVHPFEPAFGVSSLLPRAE